MIKESVGNKENVITKLTYHCEVCGRKIDPDDEKELDITVIDNRTTKRVWCGNCYRKMKSKK